MSYQVLARKWRPATFDALVGQEHVLQALRHALDNNRLHHAYLFTGTRGVGKTTIARILARCLNCEQGVSSQPCGECSACLEISEGRSVDLIEVDAASRTKVEDTRELLDNVQYAPTRSRYKVYLIDEVHMLSGHSFNALLKTLEEPPEHVKFLLATTDPQKLPATVLSRCLQFNLKNMPAERVVGHLRHVLDEEGVLYEDPALWLLGRAAAGSMRDALSLTDQAIAYGGGALGEADVSSMLGTVDRQHVFRLLEELLADNSAGLLQATAAMAEQGVDFVAAVDEVSSVLHRCAIAQAAPMAIDRELGDAERVADLAARMSPEDVQLFYQFAQVGRSMTAAAGEPRAAFEMLALRMLAFRPVEPLDPALTPEDLTAITGAADQEVGDTVKKPEPPSAASVDSEDSTARDIVADSPAAIPDPEPGEEAAALRKPPEHGQDAQSTPGAASAPWHEILAQLRLSGSVLNVASHCELCSASDSLWQLRLDENHATLFNDRHVKLIEAALSEWQGGPVAVRIELAAVHSETPAARRERKRAERQAQAEASIADDQRLQQLLKDFDGEFVHGSVELK